MTYTFWVSREGKVQSTFTNVPILGKNERATPSVEQECIFYHRVSVTGARPLAPKRLPLLTILQPGICGAVLWMPRYVTDQSLRTRCSLSPVNSVVISFINGNKDTSFAIQPREISTHPCRKCHASCISLTAARRKFQDTRALHLVVWVEVRVEVRVNERA